MAPENPGRSAFEHAKASEDALSGGWIPRRPTAPIVRGEGCWLIASDGRRYLDLTSGYGIAPLGHCHPEVTKAVEEQARRVIAVPNFLYCEERARFLGELVKILPSELGSIFLCNSGTEAVEAALKFSFVATGRSKFVALRGGFHGRTLGAMSLTSSPRSRLGFEPLLRAASFVGPGDLSALEEAVNADTAALIVEVIQGEAGVRPCSLEFLLEARRITRERGALLIVDEVQTGFARTGSWFACQVASDAPGEGFDLAPDLIAMAKGIANGFPLGALAYHQRVAAELRPGCHGSTFGGNPLACAAGRATLGVIRREGLVARSAESGRSLLEALEHALEGSPLVREIRGRGSMIGIELRRKAGSYLRRLTEEHGVLALPGGSTVIRLLPPLVIEPEQARLGVEALATVLET